jgi:hypothetical protein
MASRLESGSRARLFALALLTFGACLAAAVVVAKAPAGWRPASARSRSSGPVRIKSNRVRGLYPGAKKTLTLTLRNSDRKHSVLVRRVRVRNTATSTRGCAASRRNLTIRNPRFRPFRLGPGRSRRVVARLTMPNTVANACQGAMFRLRYSVVIGVRKRAR